MRFRRCINFILARLPLTSQEYLPKAYNTFFVILIDCSLTSTYGFLCKFKAEDLKY